MNLFRTLNHKVFKIVNKIKFLNRNINPLNIISKLEVKIVEVLLQMQVVKLWLDQTRTLKFKMYKIKTKIKFKIKLQIRCFQNWSNNKIKYPHFLDRTILNEDKFKQEKIN